MNIEKKSAQGFRGPAFLMRRGRVWGKYDFCKKKETKLELQNKIWIYYNATIEISITNRYKQRE